MTTLPSKVSEIVQQAYMAGDEGQPEESAVPSATDQLLALFKIEKDKSYQRGISRGVKIAQVILQPESQRAKLAKVINQLKKEKA